MYAYIDLLTFANIIRTRTGSSTQMYENVRINARTEMYGHTRVRDATTMMLNDVITTHTQNMFLYLLASATTIFIKVNKIYFNKL